MRNSKVHLVMTELACGLGFGLGTFRSRLAMVTWSFSNGYGHIRVTQAVSLVGQRPPRTKGSISLSVHRLKGDCICAHCEMVSADMAINSRTALK